MTAPTDPYGSAIYSTPGLVAYWQMHEAAGAGAVADIAAGTAANLTTGSGVTQGVAGIPGDSPSLATYFDGSPSARITSGVPVAELNVGAGDCTFEGWQYRSVADSTTIGVLFEYGDDFGNVGFQMWNFPSADGLYVADSNVGVIYQQAGVLPVDAWAHIVVARQSGTLNVYINGALVSSTSVGGLGTNYGLNLGCRAPSSYPFQGTLAQWAVYNVALTPAQISAHYALGTSTGGPTYKELAGLAAGNSVASGSAQNYRVAEPLLTTGGLGHPRSMPGMLLLGAPLPASAGAAPLVGSSAGQATASGTLSAYRARYLTAASSGRATVSVALRAKRRLVASAAGAASTTALLGQFRYLAAASAGRATVSVTLTKKGAKYLVGTAAGQAVATGTVGAKGFKNLAGSSAGQSTANAVLSAYRIRYLVATSNGQATTASALTARRLLQGSASGAATTSGLVLRRRALVALAAGQASVVVTLAKYTLRPVSGSSAGSATVSVTLRRVRPLTARADGFAVTTGLVSIPPPQIAAIVEVAMVTGWANSILDIRPGTASSNDAPLESPLVGAARPGG